MGFKFKSGDKVVVNKELIGDRTTKGRLMHEKYHFVSDMYSTLGKVLTITYEEDFREIGNTYYVEENGYYYHEDLLLPYVPKKSNVRR